MTTNTARSSDNHLPRDVTIDATGTRIAVRDYGGSGRDLLFLHGGPGPNLGAWDRFAQRMTGRFRCVAYDHRGHGHSDHSNDYSYASLTADTLAVIQQVGVVKPLLVGHSWGGMISLMFAASYPGESSGVIAVDGIIPPHYEPLSEDAWIWLEEQFGTNPVLSKLLTFRGTDDELEAMLTWARQQAPTQYDQFSEEVFRRDLKRDEDGRWRSAQTVDHLMALNRAVEAQALPEIDIYRTIADPALLVMATRGKFSEEDVNQISAVAPSLEVTWVESGHSVQDDAPEVLADLISQFAAR